MYRPYVGGSRQGRNHLTSIVDVEIDRSRIGHPLLWFALFVAAVAAGFYAWFSQVAAG